MKLRILALLLVGLLLVGCGGDQEGVTEAEAIAIALEDAGITEQEATDIHTHTGIQGNAPVYSISFQVDGESIGYVIHAVTGEILSVGEGHSH